VCGLVGFIGNGKKEDLDRVLALLSHRGPDGEGTHIDYEKKIFLGHRRLAIRDIEGGIQPMSSRCLRYVLVYNGEIYNDKDLRNELKSLGHKFETVSDTEVVLQALIEWGVSALARLDGQFALCFVDKLSDTVILARDRFGEKPLFWSQNQNGVIFASESNVLASHPWVVPKLDEANCVRFLIMGYLPPPFSILEGVQQLRPGCYLRIGLGMNPEVSESQFALPWQNYQRNRSEPNASQLRLIDVDHAVDSRRVADTEVGILLSGGVDSSLIANAAVRLGWNPSTFTIGFKDPTFDESHHAHLLAQKLGLQNFQKAFLNPSQTETVQILQTLDEPLADSSYLPTFTAFELSKQYSKVLLTGDGGDELFFGYEPYRVVRLSEFLGRVFPKWLSFCLLWILKRVPRSNSYMNSLDVAERFIDGLSSPVLRRVLVWMATLRTSDWKLFFDQNATLERVFDFVDEIPMDRDSVNSVRKFFLSTYLPGSIMTKSDRASMANSVEARTIFFYPDILNFALSRSARQEIKGKRGKQSLRRLASDAGLGEVSLRKKHGFAMPISETIRQLGIEAPIVALSSINQLALNDEWDKLLRGKSTRVPFLWSVLSLVNCRSYRLAVSS
jgi:asparagine synthase (glutamine-hydrolysing)